VGVTFTPYYPSNVYRIKEVAAQRFVSNEPIPVVLVRNPDNEFDTCAIEVHVPALGDAAMIGHLPRALAAKLAPRLDAGEIWTAAISQVNIHPDHPENPGIKVDLERVEGAGGE
jgi:hypothetical protein